MKITFAQAVKLIEKAEIILAKGYDGKDIKPDIGCSSEDILITWDDNTGSYEFQAIKDDNETVKKVKNSLTIETTSGQIELFLYELTPIA